MTNPYWLLMVVGKSKERYSTREEATEAAIKYLRENPTVEKIPIQEFDEKGTGKRGRIVFHVGEYFHFVDTEWLS